MIYWGNGLIVWSVLREKQGTMQLAVYNEAHFPFSIFQCILFQGKKKSMWLLSPPTSLKARPIVVRRLLKWIPQRFVPSMPGGSRKCRFFWRSVVVLLKERNHPSQLPCQNITHVTRWAIQDLNLPALFARGNIALLGDAAHAMAPHHGTGAGHAIEASHPHSRRRLADLFDRMHIRLPFYSKEAFKSSFQSTE